VGRVKDAYFSTPLPVPRAGTVCHARTGWKSREFSIFTTTRDLRRCRQAAPGLWADAGGAARDNCTKCEQCVEKCPQQLAIPELLEKADIS